MLLYLSGDLVKVSVLLPRSPGDAETLLFELRDSDGASLKLIALGTSKLRQLASVAAGKGRVKLAVEAEMVPLGSLTDGRVGGYLYRRRRES